MNVLFFNLERNFVQGKIYHPIHPNPPLDIGYCASVLDKNEHKTFFLDTAIDALTIDSVMSFIRKENIETVVTKPHLSVISATLNLSKEIKKTFPDIKILCMGPSVTYLLSSFLFENSPIDACIVGEAEYTLRDFLNSENNFEVDGIAFFDKNIKMTKNRKLIENLDELPYPKHNFFLNRGYTIYYPLHARSKLNLGFMFTSRGCPFKCIFCSPIDGRSTFGNLFRFRNPENVVDEIEYLTSLGVNSICFYDSVFTANRDKVRKICNLIIDRKIDISWTAETRVNAVDKITLEKMKRAGCSSLAFGIESGSDRILKKLNKVATVEQAKDAVNLTKNCGIDPVGFFIIGNPTETVDEMKQSLKLALSLPLDMIQVSFFTPFPGSPAYSELNFDGNLDKYNMQNASNTTQLSLVSPSSLVMFQKYFYKRFYISPRFLSRYLIRFIKSTLNHNSRNEIKLWKEAYEYIFLKQND